MEAVLTAIIGGLCVAIPSIIATITSNRTNNSLTNYKIEELTKEVREHNNFAKRMPIVEEKIKSLEQEIKEIKHSL